MRMAKQPANYFTATLQLRKAIPGGVEKLSAMIALSSSILSLKKNIDTVRPLLILLTFFATNAFSQDIVYLNSGETLGKAK
jgi:hypothetical protein